MNRRAFTFASLALAGTAAAAEPPVAQEAQGAQPVAKVGGTWDVKAAPGELTVTLALRNLTSDPLDVLVKRGSRPGPRISAFVRGDGEEIALAAVANPEADRREMVSRMGPIPVYEALVAGKSLEVGPYRFVLPEGAEKEAFRFVAKVALGDAGTVEIEHTTEAGRV